MIPDLNQYFICRWCEHLRTSVLHLRVDDFCCSGSAVTSATVRCYWQCEQEPLHCICWWWWNMFYHQNAADTRPDSCTVICADCTADSQTAATAASPESGRAASEERRWQVPLKQRIRPPRTGSWIQMDWKSPSSGVQSFSMSICYSLVACLILKNTL